MFLSCSSKTYNKCKRCNHYIVLTKRKVYIGEDIRECMTNGTEDHREEVYDALDKVHYGVVIAQALESHGETNVGAQAARDEIGRKYLTTEPLPGQTQPRFTEETLNALPEEAQQQEINRGFEAWRGTRMHNAITTSQKHLDDILKKDNNYDPSLGKIASEDEIVSSTGDEERNLLSDYRQISTYSALEDLIKKDKPIPAEAKDQLRKIYSAAASRKQYEALKDAPEDLRELFAEIAALAPGEELSKEDQLRGITDLKRKEDERMKKKYGDNYEQKVYGVVAQSLKKMFKSGNPEKERKAISMLYAVKQGYGLGGQDFSEVFSNH